MESEYVALTRAAKKVIHLRLLLSELGFPQTSPTTIFEDNKSAINLAVAPEITKNAKHIAIRHHYIRDLVKTSQVCVSYIPTMEQTADILTKPMDRALFTHHRSRLLNTIDTTLPTTSVAESSKLASRIPGGVRCWYA